MEGKNLRTQMPGSSAEIAVSTTSATLQFLPLRTSHVYALFAGPKILRRLRHTRASLNRCVADLPDRPEYPRRQIFIVAVGPNSRLTTPARSSGAPTSPSRFWHGDLR